MGDVWPVPGGGGAASLLGTSPEQRKRSIPSGVRVAEASAGLSFPPLWETSVWCVMCGVWCVMCVVWCVMCVVLCCVVLCCCGESCCVVLCCVEVYGVVLCGFCSRRRCSIQNEDPISESIGKNNI